MIEDHTKVHYLTREECAAKSAELKKIQEDDPTHMLELRFVKDDAGWYADVPTHTRGQNSMVCGADTMLDLMAGGRNEIIVKFRTVANNDKPIVTLRRITHGHGLGGSYLASGLTAIPFPIWLCDVTHDVLGEHEKRIYVHSIETR